MRDQELYEVVLFISKGKNQGGMESMQEEVKEEEEEKRKKRVREGWEEIEIG